MQNSDYQTIPIGVPIPPIKNTDPYDTNKKIFVVIIVGIGVVLCVALLIFLAIKFSMSRTQGNANFENMTKEEAWAFLQKRKGLDQDIMPENYVGNEISSSVVVNGNTLVSDIDITYSYDNVDEFKRQEIAEKPGMSVDNYRVEDYRYYTIARPNQITTNSTSCDRSSGPFDNCDSILSFKREFLDYRRDQNGSSSSSNMYLTTRDSEAANYLLRVVSWFSHNALSGDHGNIHSYDFTENNNEFLLTVNYVGAGANMDKATAREHHFAINLYHKRFSARKTDGFIDLVPTSTGVMDYTKSFPLSDEEWRELSGN